MKGYGQFCPVAKGAEVIAERWTPLVLRELPVQFDFSGLPAPKRTWWLVSNGEEVDLCPNDPGYEVGLYVATDLRTMTRVFMGDLALKAAISSGQIELDGSRELRQQFERWLGLSGFADIEDARCQTGAGRHRDRTERRRTAHHHSA